MHRPHGAPAWRVSRHWPRRRRLLQGMAGRMRYGQIAGVGMGMERAGRVLTAAAMWLTVALLVWAPIPLGSNRPWAWSLLAVWVAVVLAGVGAGAGARQPAARRRPSGRGWCRWRWLTTLPVWGWALAADAAGHGAGRSRRLARAQPVLGAGGAGWRARGRGADGRAGRGGRARRADAADELWRRCSGWPGAWRRTRARARLLLQVILGATVGLRRLRAGRASRPAGR